MKEFRLFTKVVFSQSGDYILRIPIQHKEEYNSFLKFLVDKFQGNAELVVRKPKRKRSTGKNSQNAHINVHIQQLATETGQPFGDIKEYCKSRAIDMGYPLLLKDDGTPALNLWGMPRGISESDAEVEDAIKLIDSVHQLAAEQNVILREE